jgi:hypothetical protein
VDLIVALIVTEVTRGKVRGLVRDGSTLQDPPSKRLRMGHPPDYFGCGADLIWA